MPRTPNAGDWLSLMLLSVLWGTPFFFNELALASFPPAVLVAGRILIATIMLYVYLRASGATLPPMGRAWFPMLVMAIFSNALPFNLIAWGQQYVESSLAGILMAVLPLFVLTLAHFYLPGARLTPYRIAGFVIGFTGVVVIIGTDAIKGLSGNMTLWGAIAVLVAALSYAIGSIYARRLGATDPVRLSAGMLIVASLLSLPGAVIELPGLEIPSISAVVAMVVLGLLSTGLAALLYFRLIQGPGPTFLSFVNYFVPAWAVFAGAVFLDESLSPSLYIGLILILTGIAFSELGPRATRSWNAFRKRYFPAATSKAAR